MTVYDEHKSYVIALSSRARYWVWQATGRGRSQSGVSPSRIEALEAAKVWCDARTREIDTYEVVDYTPPEVSE